MDDIPTHLEEIYAVEQLAAQLYMHSSMLLDPIVRTWNNTSLADRVNWRETAWDMLKEGRKHAADNYALAHSRGLVP